MAHARQTGPSSFLEIRLGLHYLFDMTPEEFARARRTLMRRDAVLAPVIRKYRQRTLLDSPPIDPFSSLVRTITSQQLSTKAAATIHGRILELMPGRVATPHALKTIED